MSAGGKTERSPSPYDGLLTHAEELTRQQGKQHRRNPAATRELADAMRRDHICELLGELSNEAIAARLNMQNGLEPLATEQIRLAMRTLNEIGRTLLELHEK